ncbi:MAG: hypothetical protein JWN48_448 [Myxococcaceae bacterium]|nr:hypothetical protein [Myxococcaceae bacterium]
MGRHRVIDLRSYLDPSGLPRAEHAREAQWLGDLVEVVTACRTGARWERAALPCDDLRCAGRMGVRRIGDACEWFCAQCAGSGAVLGWRNTRWDLTQLERDDEVDRSDALVFARLEELAATRGLGLLPKLRLPLALAAAHADYVIVSFSERELAELLDALDECSGERLVERFAARLDSALLACEARKVEPPTVH